MEVTNREALEQLAQAYGVATEYWGYDGTLKTVATPTLLKVLAAMGVEEVTDENIWQKIDQQLNRHWYQVLPQYVVAISGRENTVSVHVPHGSQVWVEAVLDNGQRESLQQLDDYTAPREIAGVLTGQATFALPALPFGYHELYAYVRLVGAPETEVSTHKGLLISAPARARMPEKRGWGMMAQLYSVRSHASWGLGDLADLAELGAVCAEHNADFVLINPLHAAEPVGHMTPSPYLPVTRRFFNPIYIRPEDIPEVAYLSATARAQVQAAAEKVRQLNTVNELLDRDAVWAAKKEALEVIYAAPRSRAREQAFARFQALEGAGLADFALWCALLEDNGGVLPAHLQDSTSLAVAQERVRLATRVEFWAWLQWIVDQQLAHTQQTVLAAGMEYGICHDLAVGVHPVGADTWSNPQAFAAGMAVGAPPDMYNQQGQNWSQPPWQPTALAASGFAPLREMARTVLRHAGALRIDHVMGLFRLWWIPEGNLPSEGTYVRFDHEAMVSVLLLEAHLANAVLIGEDLGTVEPWVRTYLQERGILGTSVFWFEKQADGSPLYADAYRAEILATVNTHDLPPAAGYLAEEHVEIRARLGLLEQSEEDARAAARQEREQAIARLQEYGLLGDDLAETTIIEALHRYIAHTPALLLGVSLTDAVGERRAQNQPGTDQEYPNWKVPLADGTQQLVLVEDLATNVRLCSLAQALNQEIARH